MTSAYLHQKVAEILPGRRGAKASLDQKQRLAAVIHLCGAKYGERFAARGFQPRPGELCGTHSLPLYLQKIDLLKNRFARMAGN
jgi:hypothetical protein